ncbi:MAG: hypothetical protein R2879_09295 [Saprospiraceae bacterium]
MKITRLDFYLLLVLMSLEWVSLAQSSADLIPRSVLFDLSERKEMIQLSPDGEKVFF